MSKYNIKINNITYISVIILLLSLIVTPFYIRGIILPNKMRSLNIFAYFAIFLILIKNFKNSNKYIIYILLITTTIYIYSQLLNNISFLSIISFYLGIIYPLFLFSINLSTNTFIKIFKSVIKIYNVFVIILLLFGVINIITNNSVTEFWASIFNDAKFTAWIYSSSSRYFSFMGHPLYNSELFLIFFVLNNLNNIYFKKRLSFLTINIISMIGIGITGSKTGLFLLIIGIFLLTFYNKKVFLIQISLLIIGLLGGVFNVTLDRLKSGSLTTGRLEMWEKIQYAKIYPIKILTGYGSGFTFYYNSLIQYASAAFEYPIRMFSLEYGVIFCILIYSIIFIYPMVIILVNRHFLIAIGYILIFIDINTYNGIALAQDQMFMYCLISFLFVNLSQYIARKEFKKDG